MSSDDIESTIRDQLHNAIDPLVPNPNATTRVMDAVAASGTKPSSRFHIGQGLATVLVASLVVLVVGGALGVSLALRGQTTPNGTSTHPVVPLATPTPSPLPPSPTPSPMPAVPAGCDGANLTPSFLDFDGAAGSEGGDIMLKNIGNAPCTMEGYTTLEGVANDHAMHLGVVRVQSVLINNSNGTMPAVRLITLQPGQAAYVAVEWTDVQSSAATCPVYRTLLITPPQGTHGVTMTLTSKATPSFMLCALHGTQAWIDEAPVSLTRYFAGQ
ncbi:MAG TPA: DUF4232 domain-containing protein [Candidatus Dormibacteraeota bacterium]